MISSGSYVCEAYKRLPVETRQFITKENKKTPGPLELSLHLYRCIGYGFPEEVHLMLKQNICSKQYLVFLLEN